MFANRRDVDFQERYPFNRKRFINARDIHRRAIFKAAALPDSFGYKRLVAMVHMSSKYSCRHLSEPVGLPVLCHEAITI